MWFRFCTLPLRIPLRYLYVTIFDFSLPIPMINWIHFSVDISIYVHCHDRYRHRYFTGTWPFIAVFWPFMNSHNHGHERFGWKIKKVKKIKAWSKYFKFCGIFKRWYLKDEWRRMKEGGVGKNDDRIVTGRSQVY